MHARRDARRRLVIGIGAAIGARAAGVCLLYASPTAFATEDTKGTTMAEKSLTNEIRQFLVAYNEAFLAFDGAKIAPFYHDPCITVRGDGSVHGFQTRQEIEKFFGGVAEKYRNDGLRGGDFYDLEVIPIGKRSVLATVRWEQWREDRSLLRQWNQSYNLVRVDVGWQILTSTFHLS